MFCHVRFHMTTVASFVVAKITLLRIVLIIVVNLHFLITLEYEATYCAGSRDWIVDIDFVFGQG